MARLTKIRAVSWNFIALAIAFTPVGRAGAEDALSPADAEYVARFHAQFPKVESPPPLAEYANADRYDERYMGTALDKALERVTNDQGNIAWGLAYWMIALNQMYRNTGDPKYLAANVRCINAVLAARDDKKGISLWTGQIVPAWSSDKYAKRGRAVFGVHTGMIVYPILHCLLLLRTRSDFIAQERAWFDQAGKESLEALAVHDRQWRDGPAPDEGHYIMLDQEDGLDGRVKPGNRLSALGRALWTAWKLTGDEQYKERAVRMGWYIKRRLTPATDGAYYWPYWLPEEPVTQPVERESIPGEDTSHAQLTVSFPLMLAADGFVFDENDVHRLVLTVRNGIARIDDGILFGDITGKPSSRPDLARSPDGWLPLAARDPIARGRLVAFYLNYTPHPGPLDLAALIAIAKTP